MADPNLPASLALAAMLDALDDLLSPLVLPGPPPPPALPVPGLSLVSVTERQVGIGNRRGTDLAGPFAVLALKGVRLNAVVRYQYWAETPAGVDTLVSDLQARVAAADAQLRALGFLRVEAASTSLADFVADLNFWRRTADYRVLFEFNYQDADGAESLIARIPIDINSAFNEHTSVTDEMARWDVEGAPALVTRRRRTSTFRVAALTVLAFLPVGFDGDEVTIEAEVGGAARQRTFPTARDFVNAFALESAPVTLGANVYRAGRMEFPNADFPDPINLSADRDFFRVRYGADELDAGAVVYLRVLSGTG